MKMRCACRKRQVRLWAGLVLAVLAMGPVSTTAATFTVNASNDVDDGTCSVTHCSLREAILAANTNPGVDLIAFDIPGPGPHTIQPTFELPTITDPVTIDGYTQPGASPNTNSTELGLNTVLQIEIDGANAGPGNPDGILIVAGSSTVRGLAIHSFTSGIVLAGNGNNVVQGNFLGTDTTGTQTGLPFGPQWLSGAVRVTNSSFNRIGGTAEAERNLLSGGQVAGVGTANGVSIFGSSSTGNVVQGNLIGTDITGTAALGNNDGIIVREAPGNVIGGAEPGARNVISGNEIRGVLIEWFSPENIVKGNYIGTDVSGTQALGNVGGGIVIGDANRNVIGGPEPGAGNLVSANGSGIYINSSGNLVQGNLVGTDISGEADLGNSWYGIRFPNVSTPEGARRNNLVGGTEDGAGNVIRFNSVGVWMNDLSYDNGLLGNHISSNQDLGIDLSPYGVTPNDPFDQDTGPNHLQNFPELFSASVIRKATGVYMYAFDGLLHSTPNAEFSIEFFGNSACDPSGYGEGESPLGRISVNTASDGNAPFSVELPTSGPLGLFATATATDLENNTSEFSACIPVEVLPSVLPVDLDVKPHSRQNVINPRSRGRFWAAVLSEPEFDALRVDPNTAKLGAGEARPDRYTVADANRDGMPDLMMRFRTPRVGIVCGDTEVGFVAETYDGYEVLGSDSVRTTGCNKNKKAKKKK